MIEKVVLDFLTEKLDVPVFLEEPDRPPETYVLLEKTGGGRHGILKTATLAVQSYAGTLEKAARLNEKVKEAMEGIDDQEPVSRADLNSDYNFTDTRTKRYRYQAVYDFIYY